MSGCVFGVLGLEEAAFGLESTSASNAGNSRGLAHGVCSLSR